MSPMTALSATYNVDLTKYNAFLLERLKSEFRARLLPESTGRRRVYRDGDQPCDLSEALYNDRQICLQGDPGSGKTMALLNEGIRIVQGEERSEYGLTTLLLMELHSLSTGLDFSAPYEFFTAYLQGIAQKLGLSDDFPQQVYQDPGTVITLDGLDEIADPQIREKVIQSINEAKAAAIASNGKLPQIIEVATRPWVTVEGFIPYALEPLTEVQMAQIFVGELNAYFDSIYGEDGLKGKARETQIRQRTDDFLMYLSQRSWSHILRNPSYLRYAVHHQNPLPGTFGEFLEAATDGFLIGIQARRDLVEELNVVVDRHHQRLGQHISDMIPVLREMAWVAHTEKSRALPLDKILSIERWDPNGSYSNSLLSQLPTERKEQMLDKIAEKSPFLARYEAEGITTKHYFFTHLGLQEFLAGQALADRINEGKISLDEVDNMLDNSWWRQPVLYSFSSLNWNQANALAEKVIQRQDRSLMADAYHMVQGKVLLHYLEAFEAANSELQTETTIDEQELRAELKKAEGSSSQKQKRGRLGFLEKK
ncbi:hypothetical protein JXB41_08505 [Candidatus Woesearchaeota archaeon]|nr:hypothetical protein [Candidatus Woesearchaeota archaeon]